MKFVRDPKGRHQEHPRYAIGGLAGALTIAVFGAFLCATLDNYLLKSSSLAAVVSAVLVDLTNGDRSGDHLGQLTMSEALTAAAQAKADDMAVHGYFAHTSPDGKNSWYWFKQEGYTFLYAGENLAVDFTDSVDVENAWMNSPGHRANILNEHFTEIGIATAEGTYEGRPTTFVVQMFGTPAPHAAEAAPVVALTSPKEPTLLATATTVATATPAKSVAVQPAKPALKPTTATSSKPAATTTLAATSTPVASTTPVVAVVEVTPSQVLGSAADSVLPASAVPWWQYLLASPKTILTTLYVVLAIIILVLLAHATELEWHKKHLPHATAAVLLVVLMAGLLLIANVFLFSTPVLAQVL